MALLNYIAVWIVVATVFCVATYYRGKIYQKRRIFNHWLLWIFMPLLLMWTISLFITLFLIKIKVSPSKIGFVKTTTKTIYSIYFGV
jgi:hypothetical protein